MDPLETTQTIGTLIASSETGSGLSIHGSSCPARSRQPRAVTECIERYRTPEEFLTTFNPSHQCEYCRDLERAYMGGAPNIGVVGIAFGYNTAITWLMAQLRNVSEFSGVGTKMTPSQARDVAEVIHSQWGYLKVTELMHFFLLLKAGSYGKFYGAVDGMAITEAVHQYLRTRDDLKKTFVAARDERELRQEKETHNREVEQFRQCLAVCNMPVREYLELRKEHDITHQEVADFGWLLRIR